MIVFMCSPSARPPDLLRPHPLRPVPHPCFGALRSLPAVYPASWGQCDSSGECTAPGRGAGLAHGRSDTVGTAGCRCTERNGDGDGCDGEQRPGVRGGCGWVVHPAGSGRHRIRDICFSC